MTTNSPGLDDDTLFQNFLNDQVDYSFLAPYNLQPEFIQQEYEAPLDAYRKLRDFYQLSPAEIGKQPGLSRDIDRTFRVYDTARRRAAGQRKGALNFSLFDDLVPLPENLAKLGDPTYRGFTQEEYNDALTRLKGGLEEGKTPVEIMSDYYGLQLAPAQVSKRSLRGFGGNTGNLAQALQPALREILPYTILQSGGSYEKNLEQLLQKDPMIAAAYQHYGVNPTRVSSGDSIYMFDPFRNTQRRIYSSPDKSWGIGDILKIAAPIALMFVPGMQGVAASMGAALGASGAAATAIGNGIIQAGVAAASGARGGDILKAGVLGGVGGYAQGAQAAAAGAKAAGAANAAQLAKQAQLASRIASSVSAVNSLANKDYLGALNSGLAAAGTSLSGEINDVLRGFSNGADKLAGMNIDDLTQGVEKFIVKTAGGADIEDALKSSVWEYAKAGGSFPDIPGLEGVSDDVNEFFDKVKDSNIVTAISEWGSKVDDSVFQPVKESVLSLVDNVDDAIQTPDTIKSLEDRLKSVAFENLGDSPLVKSLLGGIQSLGQQAVEQRGGDFQIAFGQGGEVVEDAPMQEFDTNFRQIVKPGELLGESDFIGDFMRTIA